jgi:outer membrane protein TolC
MRHKILIIIILAISWAVQGQETLLDQYIRDGISSNLALKQKEQNYQKSLQVLREARALFYPDISLYARYSVARGGRLIEFPAGDMLNPVYSTLNYLTQSNLFPQIENQEFMFLRPHEHDTKVSLIQPLFDPKIFYNQKIRYDLVNAQKADADTYRRLLVAEIKSAYFNYLKTLRLSALLTETRKLLEENLRVNQSLYDNQKVTIDNIYLANAELSKLDQQAAEIDKSRNVAATYFNFLLNRTFNTEVLEEKLYDTMFVAVDVTNAEQSALSNREELDMVENYLQAADRNVSLNRSQGLPSIYGAVDYGFQGERYRFTEKDDYLLASVVLRWPISHGFQNRARISQAQVDREIRETQLQEVRNKISMEVIQAYYDLHASEKSILAAKEEVRSATNAFRIISRKFAEGQASQIEYISARTSMTGAEVALIIAKYDYHIKYAEFERICGTYIF